MTIVYEVQEINQHVHAIAEVAREQSTGLQEINTAVNTMDQGTQQNAAMVEESTAASHSLATEATALNNLLGQFRLDSAPAASLQAHQSRRHRPRRALAHGRLLELRSALPKAPHARRLRPPAPRPEDSQRFRREQRCPRQQPGSRLRRSSELMT